MDRPSLRGQVLKNLKRPPVSIIIPFHAQYEHVTRCVASILRCTPNQDYQICLVDDGSPNETFLNNMKLGSKKITGIRLPEQRGFGAALQAGYLQTENPWLVFMHSDVEVKNIHWLINLQRSMYNMKKQGVKLISSRMDSAGTAADYDERLLSYEALPEDLIVEKALPLACVYCHRELFKRIGGFIKSYNFGWFEDCELFHRMKHYKFKQAISAGSWVHHEGGITIGNLWKENPDTKRIMNENLELCRKDLEPFRKKPAT